MATTEIVYLARDNTIDLLLKANGAAVDLSSITRMDLEIGGITVSSTDAAAGSITWAQAGYATGEVRLSLGGEEIGPAANAYTATLIVFDSSNLNGIVWGTVRVLVKSDV